MCSIDVYIKNTAMQNYFTDTEQMSIFINQLNGTQMNRKNYKLTPRIISMCRETSTSSIDWKALKVRQV